MTEPQVQRGRYAVVLHPEGEIELAISSGLCESCSDCRCGDQVPLPEKFMGIKTKVLLATAGRMFKQRMHGETDERSRPVG